MVKLLQNMEEANGGIQQLTLYSPNSSIVRILADYSPWSAKLNVQVMVRQSTRINKKFLNFTFNHNQTKNKSLKSAIKFLTLTCTRKVNCNQKQ